MCLVRIEAAVLDRLTAMRRPSAGYTATSASSRLAAKRQGVRVSEAVDAQRTAGIYWRCVLVPEEAHHEAAHPNSLCCRRSRARAVRRCGGGAT